MIDPPILYYLIASSYKQPVHSVYTVLLSSGSNYASFVPNYARFEMVPIIPKIMLQCKLNSSKTYYSCN